MVISTPLRVSTTPSGGMSIAQEHLAAAHFLIHVYAPARELANIAITGVDNLEGPQTTGPRQKSLPLNGQLVALCAEICGCILTTGCRWVLQDLP